MRHGIIIVGVSSVRIDESKKYQSWLAVRQERIKLLGTASWATMKNVKNASRLAAGARPEGGGEEARKDVNLSIGPSILS
jgi:hypothetical protein